MYKKAERFARLFCDLRSKFYRNWMMISNAAVNPIPQWITPVTLVIGPVLPLMALSSSAAITSNVSIIASKLALASDEMGIRPIPFR